jgi:5'-deoxynucleotidase YfbR-like HD superfamily hydrolase
LFKNKKLSPIVKYFIHFCYAKQLYRAGWLKKGLNKNYIERVAGHTEGVFILSDIIARLEYPELNLDHIHELASFHELGESNFQDVIQDGGKYEGMTKEEKRESERKAISEMLSDFSKEIQDRILGCYDEVTNMTSPEGQLVNNVDKLESCFQALIYEYQYPATDLSEFFINVRNYIDDKKLIYILDELESLRVM